MAFGSCQFFPYVVSFVQTSNRSIDLNFHDTRQLKHNTHFHINFLNVVLSLSVSLSLSLSVSVSLSLSLTHTHTHSFNIYNKYNDKTNKTKTTRKEQNYSHFNFKNETQQLSKTNGRQVLKQKQQKNKCHFDSFATKKHRPSM